MPTEILRTVDNVLNLLLDAVCVLDAEGRFVFISAAGERIFGYAPQELIGRNMIELVHPEDRERTLKAAAEIMHNHLLMNFENRYIRKDGGIVDIMWSARWSESHGRRLAVAHDVSALKHAQRTQSAIYRISEAAHSADGLPALYRHIHGIIGELLPAKNFLVALYDKSNDSLTFPYVIDEREQGHSPHPPASCTRIEEVIRTAKGLLTVAGDSFAKTASKSTPNSDYANWLGVPLISHDGVIGALVVQTRAAGAHYTEEQKDLLQFVSIQVATVIERKQKETRLHHLALHDPLTDLPNRVLFDDRLAIALRRAHRDGERLALLFFDVDKFKQINDSFGHHIGDLLLREIADRLVHCVRDSDTVARIGGDEFTLILTRIQRPDSADAVADKIRAAVNTPFEIDGKTLTISASIGIAIYPEHGNDRDQLMRHADSSMYAAKSHKR